MEQENISHIESSDKKQPQGESMELLTRQTDPEEEQYSPIVEAVFRVGKKPMTVLESLEAPSGVKVQPWAIEGGDVIFLLRKPNTGTLGWRSLSGETSTLGNPIVEVERLQSPDGVRTALFWDFGVKTLVIYLENGSLLATRWAREDVATQIREVRKRLAAGDSREDQKPIAA